MRPFAGRANKCRDAERRALGIEAERLLGAGAVAGRGRGGVGVLAAQEVHEVLEVHAVVAQHEILLGLGAPLAAAEDLGELRRREPAVPVVVEDAEGVPAHVLLQVRLLVQACGQELGVVDRPGAGEVHALEDLVEVPGHLLTARSLQAPRQLIHAQEAVFVGVQSREHLAELASRGRVLQLACDDVERSLPELALRPEAAELSQEIILEGDGLGTGRTLLDPDVGEGLLRRVALAGVHPQHVADEVLRVARDVGPVPSPEGELADGDLAHDLRLRPAVEGRLAAEQDVHDATAAPHVAHPVVAPLDHLRRHVLGAPRELRVHGAGLGMARKAEVNDLQDVALDGVLGLE
mmetsp:Transcript_91103/g.281764  ORF Transcript_91103/g.281764 Transcript_91103/m.281764 type:complete len:350 (-) Transcript_91103:569-1618(-)